MAATAVDQRPPSMGTWFAPIYAISAAFRCSATNKKSPWAVRFRNLFALEEAEAEFKMRQGHEPSREEMASNLGISQRCCVAG